MPVLIGAPLTNDETCQRSAHYRRRNKYMKLRVASHWQLAAACCSETTFKIFASLPCILLDSALGLISLSALLNAPPSCVSYSGRTLDHDKFQAPRFKIVHLKKRLCCSVSSKRISSIFSWLPNSCANFEREPSSSMVKPPWTSLSAFKYRKRKQCR